MSPVENKTLREAVLIDVLGLPRPRFCQAERGHLVAAAYSY